MKAKVLVDNITKNQWKAEWGLSIYIEDNGHRILLDTGTTEAFAENADQMGVRLEDVEEPQDEGDLEGDEVWSD